MHTYHAEAIIGSEGKIELTLPFKKGEKVAVVGMPIEDTLEARDEQDWTRLGLENFFKDDSECDSAYNLLYTNSFYSV